MSDSRETDLGRLLGPSFFGQMTASVSHEVNNVLAMIGQKAGLAEDLIDFSAESGRIDPVRIKTIVQSIQSQVQKGSDIVRALNRFAHTADEVRQTVDICAALDTLLTVSRRILIQRGCSAELEATSVPVLIPVDPFLLQNALWLALDQVCRIGLASVISVSVRQDAAGARVIFRRPPHEPLPEPDAALLSLLAEMGGSSAWECCDVGCSMVITFSTVNAGR